MPVAVPVAVGSRLVTPTERRHHSSKEKEPKVLETPSRVPRPISVLEKAPRPANIDDEAELRTEPRTPQLSHKYLSSSNLKNKVKYWAKEIPSPSEGTPRNRTKSFNQDSPLGLESFNSGQPPPIPQQFLPRHNDPAPLSKPKHTWLGSTKTNNAPYPSKSSRPSKNPWSKSRVTMASESKDDLNMAGSKSPTPISDEMRKASGTDVRTNNEAAHPVPQVGQNGEVTASPRLVAAPAQQDATDDASQPAMDDSTRLPPQTPTASELRSGARNLHQARPHVGPLPAQLPPPDAPLPTIPNATQSPEKLKADNKVIEQKVAQAIQHAPVPPVTAAKRRGFSLDSQPKSSSSSSSNKLHKTPTADKVPELKNKEPKFKSIRKQLSKIGLMDAAKDKDKTAQAEEPEKNSSIFRRPSSRGASFASRNSKDASILSGVRDSKDASTISGILEDYVTPCDDKSLGSTTFRPLSLGLDKMGFNADEITCPRPSDPAEASEAADDAYEVAETGETAEAGPSSFRPNNGTFSAVDFGDEDDMETPRPAAQRIEVDDQFDFANRSKGKQPASDHLFSPAPKTNRDSDQALESNDQSTSKGKGPEAAVPSPETAAPPPEFVQKALALPKGHFMDGEGNVWDMSHIIADYGKMAHHPALRTTVPAPAVEDDETPFIPPKKVDNPKTIKLEKPLTEADVDNMRRAIHTSLHEQVADAVHDEGDAETPKLKKSPSQERIDKLREDILAVTMMPDGKYTSAVPAIKATPKALKTLGLEQADLYQKDWSDGPPLHPAFDRVVDISWCRYIGKVARRRGEPTGGTNMKYAPTAGEKFALSRKRWFIMNKPPRDTTLKKKQEPKLNARKLRALAKKAEAEDKAAEAAGRPNKFPQWQRLPDRARMVVCEFLVDDSIKKLPILLNKKSQVPHREDTDAVWADRTFMSLGACLKALEKYIWVSPEFRADIMLTFLGTRRFHAIINPFVGPTTQPLVTTWWQQYGIYAQHCTMEVDLTKLGFGPTWEHYRLKMQITTLGLLCDQFTDPIEWRRTKPEIWTKDELASRANTMENLTVLCRRYYGNRPGTNPFKPALKGTYPPTTTAKDVDRDVPIPFCANEHLSIAGGVACLGGTIDQLRMAGFSESWCSNIINYIWPLKERPETEAELARHTGRSNPSNAWPRLESQPAVYDFGFGGVGVTIRRWPREAGRSVLPPSAGEKARYTGRDTTDEDDPAWQARKRAVTGDTTTTTTTTAATAKSGKGGQGGVGSAGKKVMTRSELRQHAADVAAAAAGAAAGAAGSAVRALSESYSTSGAFPSH